MTETSAKAVPRSPYVEEETDEEFIQPSNLSDVDHDERICRICFAGQDEVDTLGKLISPCKCRGSMKWIHVDCLNQWRRASKKESSFFRCDECRHEYSFRINSAYLLTTRPIQTSLTLAIFTGTAFTLGSLIKLALYITKTQISIHPRTISLPAAPHAGPIVISAPASLWDVFNYRDPAHWGFGLTALGIAGFAQMLLVGGIFFNVGDIFGLRRIWGGRQEGRAEIRVGGFFGGGILWIVMILVGLGKAMLGMYRSVNKMSRQILEKLELAILEVEE